MGDYSSGGGRVHWDAEQEKWVSFKGTTLPEAVQRHLNELHGKTPHPPEIPVLPGETHGDAVQVHDPHVE